MIAEKKEKYVKLLQEIGGLLANAILFYLTNIKEEYERKKQFVEKVVDRYVKVVSVSTNRYEEHIILSKIPQEIVSTLVSSYHEDVKLVQDKTEEDLIAEMNEIF